MGRWETGDCRETEQGRWRNKEYLEEEEKVVAMKRYEMGNREPGELSTKECVVQKNQRVVSVGRRSTQLLLLATTTPPKDPLLCSSVPSAVILVTIWVRRALERAKAQQCATSRQMQQKASTMPRRRSKHPSSIESLSRIEMMYLSSADKRKSNEKFWFRTSLLRCYTTHKKHVA